MGLLLFDGTGFAMAVLSNQPFKYVYWQITEKRELKVYINYTGLKII